MKYEIEFRITQYGTLVVEADTPEAAKEQVLLDLTEESDVVCDIEADSVTCIDTCHAACREKNQS